MTYDKSLILGNRTTLPFVKGTTFRCHDMTKTDDLSNLSSKHPIVVASLLLRNSYQSQPLLPHFQHLLDRQQLLTKVNLLQRPLEKLAMVPELAEKQ